VANTLRDNLSELCEIVVQQIVGQRADSSLSR